MFSSNVIFGDQMIYTIEFFISFVVVVVDVLLFCCFNWPGMGGGWMRVKWISTFIVDRYCKLIAMEFVVGIIDCINDVFVKRYSAIKSTAPTKSRHFTKRDFPNYYTELLRCSDNNNNDDEEEEEEEDRFPNFCSL